MLSILFHLSILSCHVRVDGPKSSYDQNYETLLKLVRVGGVIAIDNTLWNARVVDQQVHVHTWTISCMCGLVESAIYLPQKEVLWLIFSDCEQITDESTIFIREFNDKIFNDSRVSASLMHIGDGLTLCRKL